MKTKFLLSCLFVLFCALAAGAADQRLLTLDDLDAIRTLDDPQISPEGDWVAYTVTINDIKEDKKAGHLWTTSWDGKQNRQLTFAKEGEAEPRWSPDGRYLAFTSSRGADEGQEGVDQIWLLERTGGDPVKLTEFKGGVTDYAWSPDSRTLAVVARDEDPNAYKEGEKDEKGNKKSPKPIVIDRFQFKQDIEGYLTAIRQHLYLVDVEKRKPELLTAGAFNEYLPAWSPDGSLIAFVSKRGPDPDRTMDFNVYVIEPRAGAAARQLTTYPGSDLDPDWESYPSWSPDSKSIAYLQGGDPRMIYYAPHQLAVISVAGGEPRLLAPNLDRNVTKPQWSADGKQIYFRLEDDRAIQLARINVAGGKVERLTPRAELVDAFDVGKGDRLAVLAESMKAPAEVFTLNGADLKPVTHQNDELISRLKLADVEEINFKSKDGAEIHGFLMRPAEGPGRNAPTILRVHGGPADQYQHEFRFDWQLLAAHGYAVIGANPRGSSGRGLDFSRAIFADWGNKDVQDVLAAVDYAVERGVADPKRLGVGGWSYGGILTNYTIAQDHRFRAAVSGAGASNILAGYGTDMYVREYEYELGKPWEHPEIYQRLSYPFLHADRIVTPVLFLGGDRDFNVPLLNSEQMYQALRSLGRETQLIIYPGQFHDIKRPSFMRDRLRRYLEWYDRFVKVGSQ